MSQITMDSLVKNIEELPALPKVVHRVLRLINNPETPIESISSAINRDQALTFRILKLANSAYFGYSRRISTVREALTILGLNITKNLILAVSTCGIMNKPIDGYVLGKGDLWKHSVVTALIARSIAERTGAADPEKAFTAGLLHDIGKVVMNTYIEPQLREVVDLTEKKRVSFMKAEEVVLGFNHAQLGGRVATYWKLPRELVDAIEYHHEPILAETNPKLASIVHIADVLCMTMGVGLGGDGLLYTVDGEALQLLELKLPDLDALIAEMVDVVNENEEVLLLQA